jgi:hypothetical protein
MSVRWISQVWESSPYKGERLLLHLALADFANDEGFCWPSQTTLAKKARCSNNWVRLSISQMVKDGFVQIVEPAGAGRGKVGRYRLLGHSVDTHTQKGYSEEGHTVRRERPHSDTSDTYILNRQEPSLTRADFESIWKQYPRKVAKGAAWRAWQKMMQSPEPPALDVLTTAVELYARSITEMRYCAHMATWIGQQRWLDDVTPTGSTSTPVRLEPRINDAMAMGNVAAMTGQSEADLVESIAHRQPDEQAAALDRYRQASALHRSR